MLEIADAISINTVATAGPPVSDLSPTRYVLFAISKFVVLKEMVVIIVVIILVFC